MIPPTTQQQNLLRVKRSVMQKPQFYRARETAREDEVDGVRLASFRQRALAFTIDFAIVAMLRKPVEFAWQRLVEHNWEHHTLIDLHHVRSLMVLVLYFAAALYFGKGKTLGKRLVGIRVLSLSHKQVTLWESTERALGYGASTLECGFGFLQFFFDRNRQCTHDRIAATIVVDDRHTRETLLPFDTTVPSDPEVVTAE